MSKEAEKLADKLDSSDANFYGESSLWFDSDLSDAVSDAADLLRRQAEQIRELRSALIAMDEATKGKFGNLEFMAMASQKTGAALSNTKEET